MQIKILETTTSANNNTQTLNLKQITHKTNKTQSKKEAKIQMNTTIQQQTPI